MGSDFRGRVLLAPMAGVSDAVFRALCEEQGADLAFTEMVSSKALSYASEKTRSLLTLPKGEQRVGVQIFGHEPAIMADQAAWLSETMGPSLACIDINMGCPVRKVAGKGDGAALMKDPDLAERIVAACVSATHVPITVKFRRGFNQGRETAPEFARRMEQAGAIALTVHGRFAEQMYQGSADWDCIARVKRAVGVPVAGNGDVRSGQDALELLDRTSCDSIMVARAAQGNPWIFAEMQAALAGKEYRMPSLRERLGMIRRHARMLAIEGDRGMVRMRKHACWYMEGLPGASRAREAFNQCRTLEDFETVISGLEEHAARSL